MTLDELRKHPAYSGLSEKYRAYVDARCAGQDKMTAAKGVYTCKDERSARSMANQAERHGKVRWLIEQFYGRKHIPTAEEAAGQFWEWALGASDDAARAKFASLTLQVLGYNKKPAEVTPPSAIADDGADEFQL